MSALLLPLSTFHRVFDTVPVQEVVTLPEMVAALRRFALRPDILARSQREVGRIRRSVARAKAGLHASGRHAAKLAKAAEAARRQKKDPAAAVEALGLELEAGARKDAKRDLRIWSPALYRPGADKRAAENVTHISCLVLDYDDGTPIPDASAVWSRWFHLIHSTWSHDEAHPRFRVVLPLAHPVPSERWPAVWGWAAELAGGHVDAALKSPASTYALPAVPNTNWPREALSRPGAILDPVVEGVLAERVTLVLEPQRPSDGGPSLFRGEHPDEEHIDHLDETALYFVDDDLDWDPLDEPEAAADETPTQTTDGTPTELAEDPDAAPEPEPAPEPERIPPEPIDPAKETRTGPGGPGDTPLENQPVPESTARVLAALSTLERRFAVHPMVEGLERLAAMREAGTLTQKEFREAKRRLLESS